MTLDCNHAALEIVYKDTAKTVPDRLLNYYVDHPEEAKQKLQVLCRNCQAIKLWEMRQFQRVNR